MILLVMLLLGLVIGSFLNALIWRFKIGKSITRGRSMCPDCKHELTAVDLIPVISWLMLRGKCRHCHKPISVQYPLVEVITSGLFGLSYWSLMPDSTLQWVGYGVWLYILTSLIFLGAYDLKWYLLPDRILLPAIGVGAAWLMVQAVMEASFGVLIPYFGSALLAGGVFYAIAALSGGKWLGGGDIKLVFLMGLVLGPTKTLLALLFAFNSAALIGLALIGLKLKTRKDLIPFGPFLVAGTIIAYLLGGPVIEWYMNLTGLGML